MENEENKIATYQKERDDAIVQRNQLQSEVARQFSSIQRLQCVQAALEEQLSAASTAGFEAVRKCEEIKSRELTINCSYKFLSQERELLTLKIIDLEGTLEKNTVERNSTRQEHLNSRMQLELDLTKKSNDLQIADRALAQFSESNLQLTSEVDDLRRKLRAQSDESTKLMEEYQNELKKQTKLCKLYQENIDDRTAENKELQNGFVELKEILDETVKSSGDLETKLRNVSVIHQIDLGAKELTIAELREELKNANKLLQPSHEETLQDVSDNLTPEEAAACHHLQSNVTLTQFITLYVQAVEDLQRKDRELNQTQLILKNILTELEEIAPVKKRQAIEFQEILANYKELSIQLEKNISEKVTVRDELIEAEARIGALNSEIMKLKSSNADLRQQNAHLLHEDYLDQAVSSNMSANEFISKQLLTFNDITELQDHNQRLLLLVRDLSRKCEELEVIPIYEDIEKKNFLDFHNKCVEICELQKDRFKKLFYDLLEESTANSMRASDVKKSTMGNTGTDTADAKDETIAELQKMVEDGDNKLRTLKEQHVEYRREKLVHDKQHNEQYEAIHKQVQELQAKNCELTTSVSFQNDHIKTHQANAAKYKKKIETLEDLNRTNYQTIVRHEAEIVQLHEQEINLQKNLASAERKCEERREECYRLAGDLSQLTIDRQTQLKESLSMKLLQDNIKMLKNDMERTNVARLLMDTRFDNVKRECSALRHHLHTEQVHYRNKKDALIRKTEVSFKKMIDELAEADSLRSEVGEERQNFRNNLIADLIRKLQDSFLTPIESESIIAEANLKIEELQNAVDLRTTELEQLKLDYCERKAKCDQLNAIVAEWEAESEQQHGFFEEYKTKMAEEIFTVRINEANAISRVEELETENNSLITDAQMTADQLLNVQTELNKALSQISENDVQLCERRDECVELKSSLQTIEMMQQSGKDDLNKAHDQIQKLRDAHEVSFGQYSSEKANLEKRLLDLEAQTTSFYVQLQVNYNFLLLYYLYYLTQSYVEIQE